MKNVFNAPVKTARKLYLEDQREKVWKRLERYESARSPVDSSKSLLEMLREVKK